MSVPFSNTNLRVPRGFGSVLEGLAREVLRDQPEDIAAYAARYFQTLLRQREESGTDPSEWAAKLEDRFYNNHAFKAPEQSSPEKEVTISKENPDESQTEDEPIHSTEALNLSTAQPSVSEGADLTGNMEKEEVEDKEEEGDVTEKDVTPTEGLPEEESIHRLLAADVQPGEHVGTEEEKDLTITTFDHVDSIDNEKHRSSFVDQDISHSELQPADSLSFRGISSADVCAQEFEMAEDDGADKEETVVVDKEIVEEKTDIEEPVEDFPYTKVADVDVCAAELGATEVTMEGNTDVKDDDDEDKAHVVEEESSKPQPEEQSSLLQSVTPDDNKAEDDQAKKTDEEEEETMAGSFSGGTHESLVHKEGVSDSNATPEEDSLVEISFEDVPEAQQIKEFGEKQPEEENPVDVLQNNILEMQQEDKSEEVIAVAADQNISGTQDRDEPAMLGIGKEVNSEEEEMESQHEACDIMKEKVDTNDSNLNDSGGDEIEGVKNIISSHQPTTEADEGDPEDEIDHKNEDYEKIKEGEFPHQITDSGKEIKPSSPDCEEDETIDPMGGDKGDIQAESYAEVKDQEINEGVEGNLSSQVTQLNISAAAMEAGGETLHASPPEESEESLVKSQLEETAEEREVTTKERTSGGEGPVDEGTIDSEMQEESDAMCEEGSLSLDQSRGQPAPDLQGEERPLRCEEDTAEPESNKQEECSRPQEEEDIMDIPLDDPEANRAAAKIQAGFRGHMTRKKMKPEDKAEAEERQEDRGQ